MSFVEFIGLLISLGAMAFFLLQGTIKPRRRPEQTPGGNPEVQLRKLLTSLEDEYTQKTVKKESPHPQPHKQHKKKNPSKGYQEPTYVAKKNKQTNAYTLPKPGTNVHSLGPKNPPMGAAVMSRLTSRQDMVVLSEILGAPRATRPYSKFEGKSE